MPQAQGRVSSPLESLLEEHGITHEHLDPGSEARLLLERRQELVLKALKEEAERELDELVCLHYQRHDLPCALLELSRVMVELMCTADEMSWICGCPRVSAMMQHALLSWV